jgi:ABC-2 type transport system permease protein
MSGVNFTELFAADLRRIGRSPLLWIVQALLLASFLWGAYGTARFHREQTADQARTVQAEAAWLNEVKERIGRYITPAPPGTPMPPTWQDPTDLAGFARFLLFAHSMKPHLPLSPLSIGASELSPTIIDIKLNRPYVGDPTYDLLNPRALKTGIFDLGFALTYLTPLAVLLLFGLLGTVERDRGILPMIAAHPLPARRWLGARSAALFIWTAGPILLWLIVTLALVGVPIFAADTTVAILLVLAWGTFWTGLAALTSARFPSAATATGRLIALWFGLTIGLPLLAGLAETALDPAPSRTLYVNDLRLAGESVERDREAIIKAGLKADPALRHVARKDVNDLATFSFTVPETERRLAQTYDAIQAHRREAVARADMLGFVMPPLGLSTALSGLAGTDEASQLRFEDRARAFQMRLRDDLYGRARVLSLHPVPYDPVRARGQMNYLAFDDLPRDPPVTQLPRTGYALAVGGWLMLLGLGLFAATTWRASAWRP